MKITKAQLKAWDACRDGYEWFLRKFPEGEAPYQAVLDAQRPLAGLQNGRGH